MKKVAIIPARGGSKRIPRKNIKLFAGKPVIGYSIEVALGSGLFDRVIVSTDDPEIATVAEEFGAEVPFMRPADLADDYTGTVSVVAHALQWLESHDYSATYACCIYATAPFLASEYLLEGLNTLVNKGKAYAFSVTTFAFPVQRAIRIRPDGHVEAVYPENASVRSQDLEEMYHDAGQFYWGRWETFTGSSPLFSQDSVPVILPRYLVQDLDTLEDWQRAELMFEALQ
jgi:N-acylneuraminate cytidylyltransferase